MFVFTVSSCMCGCQQRCHQESTSIKSMWDPGGENQSAFIELIAIVMKDYLGIDNLMIHSVHCH